MFEPLTSQYLQKKFPEVYQNFFVNTDLVMHSYFSFGWNPESIGHTSQLIILQSKIPLGAYVGLKKTNKKGSISFSRIQIFIPQKGNFLSVTLKDISSEADKIILSLEKLLKEKGWEFGVEIEILCEIGRGFGLSFTGTVFAGIVSGLYTLAGEIAPQKLDTYTNFIQTPLFHEIVQQTRCLEYINKYGNPAAGSLSALYAKPSPFGLIYEIIDPEKGIEQIKNNAYEIFSFQEKFSDQVEHHIFPLDIALINTGKIHDTLKTNLLLKTDKRSFEDYQIFFHKYFDKKRNYHLNHIFKQKHPYDTVADIMSLLSLKSIYLITKIFASGEEPEYINAFIDHINTLDDVSRIVEKTSHFGEDLRHYFRINTEIRNEKVGTNTIYTGKGGGTYIVVMKQGTSRDIFEKTLNDLKKLYPDLTLLYISWNNEGSPIQGISIKQFVSQGLYAEGTGKEKIIYIDNQGNKYLSDHSTIYEKEKNGLLLDAINGKIYLNGEKLTANEIKSQSTTIELFSYLLEHPEEEIWNNQLPTSSYAGQQNQMLGKIILPLIKLCEEKFGKKLPLICKGSLREFYIKLEKTPIKIGIIKKI